MEREVVQETVAGLVTEFVAARNAHDVDRLTSLFAEDGSYGEFGLGTVMLGREEIRRHLTAVSSAVPALAYSLTAYPVTSREHVLLRWIMTGTQDDEFAGVAPTGKPFQVRGATFLLTSGDKILRAVDCFDVEGLLGRVRPRSAADSDAWAPSPGFLADEDNIWYGE